jgi:mannose-6-phosphate isomerase-like protein (cupin superfamily)
MRTNLKTCALSMTLGVAVLGAAVASAQAQEVHRVVTTINKDDKSAALFDGQVPLQKGGGGEGFGHRTRSVDYAIIMSGEIDMLLDTGPVHVKAGDVIVQQATNHAWLNHGKEPCRIAFVLTDSQEP